MIQPSQNDYLRGKQENRRQNLLSVRSYPVRGFVLGAFAIAFSLFATGCATTPMTPAPERRVPSERDPLAIPAEESIGRVVMVDPNEGIALIEVRSASTRATPAMMTRNEALTETGRLEPTRFQRGRTLGARIVSGLPNVGDEVIPAR